MHGQKNNPYHGSVAAELFGKSGKAAFIDIDGTLTFNEGDYSGPLAVRYIRSTLQAWNVPLFFSSARSTEMMMSTSSFESSQHLGYKRRPAHRGPRDAEGRLQYVPLESLEEFEPLLDPSGGILGFGCGVLVRHGSGYAPDIAYENMLGYCWRDSILKALRTMNMSDVEMLAYMKKPGADIGDTLRSLEATQVNVLQYLSPIEEEGAYEAGKVDVEPLPFRIQFDIPAKSSEMQHQVEAFSIYVRAKLAVMRQLDRCGLLPVQLVDESRPDEGRYTFYLVPVGSSKQEMVTHVMQKLCDATNRNLEESSALIAGDTMTDLPCCDAAPGAHVHFVLAGKSRLGRYFDPKCTEHFGDQDLSPVRKRLKGEGLFGRYRLLAKDGSKDRVFTVCDHVYPGLRAPQSIARELDDWLVSSA